MKNINVDRSIVCFWRFLQGKEEAPEATTNQTIEVTKEVLRQKKSLMVL
jgi:hypothetical protein